MKYLKYNLLQSLRADGRPILTEMQRTWSEANEEIVKRDAYNGEYEIYDDGQPEPETPETGNVVTWAALNAAYQEGVDSV